MHSPGIEPGTSAWKADILPLNYECCDILFKVDRNCRFYNNANGPPCGLAERSHHVVECKGNGTDLACCHAAAEPFRF
jgi:hypothetical protein